MKRLRFFSILLMVLIAAFALLPLSAAAEGESTTGSEPTTAGSTDTNTYLANTDFTDWDNSVPTWWDFNTDSGLLERCTVDGVNAAQVTLTEDGYAYLGQYVYFEQQTTYKITAHVKLDSISKKNAGVNIDFADQVAQGTIVDTTSDGFTDVVLYVQTNLDEDQTYYLRVGIGNTGNISAGKFYVSSVTCEKMDVMPMGVTTYALVGSLGYGDGDNSTANATATVESGKKLNATYNDIGSCVMSIFAAMALYMLYKGKWSGRLGRFLSGKAALYILFAVALIIRVYVAERNVGYETDITCFKVWARDLYTNGPGVFYTNATFADYPPLYMYVLYVIGWIGHNMEFNGALYTVLIKMPAIICDLAIAFIVFKWAAKKYNRPTGAMLALLTLFLPATIMDSCGWGQIDSLFALMSILCLYFLYKDKKVWCAMMWMACFMIKPQALLFAPLIAIVFLGDIISKDKWKRTLVETALSIVGMALVYVVIALPMKGDQSIFYVLQKMLNTTTQYPYGSVNAFNLIGVLGGNFVDVNTVGFALSYKSLGIIMIALVVLVTIVLYLKKRDKKNVFLLAAYMLAGIFTLGHTMHERYIVPAIFLLIIAAIVNNSQRTLFAAILYSVTAFLNMYIVILYTSFLVDQWIVTTVGLMNIAIFLFLTFTVVRELVFGDTGKLRIGLDTSDLPPATTWVERGRSRLESFSLSKSRLMTKKDKLIMLAITVVYAAVAFINLGSFTIPEQVRQLTGPDTEIAFRLNELTNVHQMKYYTGYGEADYELYVSTDGSAYTKLDVDEDDDTTNHTHPYGGMFKWKFIDVNADAAYLKIVITEGTMDFREIAFTDASSNVLPIKNVTLTIGGKTEDGQYLIDEQDQVPQVTSYMTDMYFDEVYHARTAYEYTHGIYPYEITHPPFGKSIIALGTLIFGFTPFGWRFMGTLFGVLMLPLIYIFAKRLFKNTTWAAVATVIFASDTMHYALTRIATVDSFSVFFIIAMYFFMYEYTTRNYNKEPLWKTLIPLGLCGISFAFGAATKWICLYAAVGLCVVFFYTVYQRIGEYRAAKADGNTEITSTFRKKMIITLIFCVLVFLIIPLLVYCASYYPYENASPNGFGIKGILDNQHYMLSYHENLSTTNPHPYQSNVYSWPFDIRPVFFFNSDGQAADQVTLIWCFLNPFIAYGVLAAVIYLLGYRRRTTLLHASTLPQNRTELKLDGVPVILVAIATGYLPWMLITREVFMYHYFSSWPFLILLLTYALRHVWSNYKYGKYFVFAFVCLCIAGFIAFYPVTTGWLISRNWGLALQWFGTWPV